MIENIGAFIGTWHVGMTAHPQSAAERQTPYLLQPGFQLVIGTGENNATPPFLTGSYEICVGFAVLDEAGNPVLSTGDAKNDPLLLLFTQGSLRYAGYYNQSPLRIYLSMAEARMPTAGTVYPAIYGSTSSGDPDQVGVWGAEGNPPPRSPEPAGGTPG